MTSTSETPVHVPAASPKRAHGPAKYLPILAWGREYNRGTFSADFIAAIIVTIMLIPQSLAYALLAGLPPQAGLYASMAPLLAYALFGTSRALAVGPVAVVSLMTAASIGALSLDSPQAYWGAALLLALLSGLFLLGLSLLRLGFLANFLSHPVISGFITASGLLIAASQLKHILGISAHGHTLVEVLHSLWQGLSDVNWTTAGLGFSALAFLFWVRKHFKPLLKRLGLSEGVAAAVTRAGPVFAVFATTLVTALFSLEEQGVAIVGNVPNALPGFSLPAWDMELVQMLIGPAILISIIGFVESVSVAQTLAARKRQQIDPNQELLALGAANVGAAFTGGYPVTGGFARSIVNYDAGAATPAAGLFTAAGIGLATVFLVPLLYFLPKATLAATIIVAVLTLVDFSVLKRTWAYSKADFAAVLITILLTLTRGVEEGVTAGLLVSIGLYLYRTSKPHIAVVGRVAGTEHFRNILRHNVETREDLISIRVDESLYFANARYLEDAVYDLATQSAATKHVVLMCSAVNFIDASALESLEALNHRLHDAGIMLHLTEIKGPVMDRLQKTELLDELSGQVFLSHHQAISSL
ncbi:SulP family inorganic anion transporter [Polycladidibacter stylochi]|uniref:SulP family inorganic anion transporter n=1 Tax=Polycladidibacter stylochi TaxID=1807766 RepID=UPI0009EC262A|nr:sulfate permease [Pseudovibrio stylochi]